MSALHDLIDQYAETRHRCGHHTYNADTQAARKAVHAALHELAVQTMNVESSLWEAAVGLKPEQEWEE